MPFGYGQLGPTMQAQDLYQGVATYATPPAQIDAKDAVAATKPETKADEKPTAKPNAVSSTIHIATVATLFAAAYVLVRFY